MNSTPRPRNAGALGQGCIGLCFGTVWSQVRYGFRIRYSSTCRAPGARRRDADGAAGTRVPTALPFAVREDFLLDLRCVLAFDRFRLSDSVHRPKAEARATSSWRPDRAQRRDLRPQPSTRTDPILRTASTHTTAAKPICQRRAPPPSGPYLEMHPLVTTWPPPPHHTRMPSSAASSMIGMRRMVVGGMQW